MDPHAKRPAPSTPIEPGKGRAGLGGVGFAAALAAAVVAFFLLVPRFGQDPAYHAFADSRTLLGIPNALDVLSSVGFVLVGVAGIRVVLRSRTLAGQRAPWLVLFGGVAATGVGSTYYHLAPTTERLFWDRLPMSVGFAGFVAALVAERVGAVAGRRSLVPLLAASCASVVHWSWSEAVGAGDLRAYVLVQALALLAVPALVVHFRGPAAADRGWLGAVGLYALAKVAERFDAAVFAATGMVSGHTLKHVLAILGVAWLARMVHARDA